MKGIFRYSFLSLCLILTLAAGGGFSISRMICKASGMTTYELGQVKNCCAGGQDDCEVKSRCCEISSSALDADEHTASQKANPPSENAEVAPLPVFSPFTIFDNEPQASTSGIDPPDLGKNILRLISILII